MHGAASEAADRLFERFEVAEMDDEILWIRDPPHDVPLHDGGIQVGGQDQALLLLSRATRTQPAIGLIFFADPPGQAQTFLVGIQHDRLIDPGQLEMQAGPDRLAVFPPTENDRFLIFADLVDSADQDINHQHGRQNRRADRDGLAEIDLRCVLGTLKASGHKTGSSGREKGMTSSANFSLQKKGVGLKSTGRASLPDNLKGWQARMQGAQDLADPTRKQVLFTSDRPAFDATGSCSDRLP